MARVENTYVKMFLLGGKCKCRITNYKTGNSFEYEITLSKTKNDSSNKLYFVKVRDGGLGFIYVGYLKTSQNFTFFEFSKGAKGCMTKDNMPIKALLYILSKAPNIPSCVSVEHIGVCSRCGRKLTDADSISRGLGPECYTKMCGY